MKRDFLEEDMYEHIKSYFDSLGYTVHGEVKSCDITAQKDDQLIIFELKKSLSVDLLIQGVKRQKLSDLTYICVPRPLKFRYNAKFRDTLFLLKRLQLGLIFVDVERASIEIMLEPKEYDMVKAKKSSYNRKKRKAVETEISKRKTSRNKGGSFQKKLVTSYREDALRLLYLSSINNYISPKDGVSIGIINSSRILNNNHYGWFDKVERGKYKISNKGLKEYEDFKEVIEELNKIEYAQSDLILINEK